jgi:hypothetical protein
MSGQEETAMMRQNRRILEGLLVAAALLPRSAGAQTATQSFIELQTLLRTGDSVRVTDSSGSTTQGRVVRVSTTSLTLAVDGRHQDLPEGGIQTVTRRRPDRWWNGPLIGAAIGGVVGAVVKARNCGSTDCGEGGLVDPGFYVFGAGIGAAAGALVDHSIRRFETVFVRPPTASARTFRLSTILSKQAKGFEVSVNF